MNECSDKDESRDAHMQTACRRVHEMGGTGRAAGCDRIENLDSRRSIGIDLRAPRFLLVQFRSEFDLTCSALLQVDLESGQFWVGQLINNQPFEIEAAYMHTEILPRA